MAHFIQFTVQGFHVGAVNSSAGIFVGQNLQNAWKSSSKSNYALGKTCGDYNVNHGGQNGVIDPDYLDTYVQKRTPTQHVKEGLTTSVIPRFEESKRSRKHRRKRFEDIWD